MSEKSADTSPLKRYGQYLLIPALILVVGYVLLYLTYRDVKREIIEDLNARQLIHAKQAVRGIEAFFNDHISLLENLARNEHIILLDEAGKELMREFLSSHSEEISIISREDSRGRILYAEPYDPAGIGQPVTRMEDFEEAKRTHKVTVSDIFTNRRGFQSIILHVPIFEQGKFDGSLAMLLRFDFIARRYIEDIRIGKGGYAWVISRNGIEVSCPVPGHVGNSVFDNCREYPDILAMAEKMIRGEQGVTTYTFDHVREDTMTKTTKHAVFMPIRFGNNFWSIVVATPEDEAISGLEGFRNRLLLIAILLIAGFGVFLYLMFRARLVVQQMEQRRKTEEELDRYFTGSLDLLCIADTEGYFRKLNPEWEKTLGYAIDELEGHAFMELVHPDDREATLAAVGDLSKQKEVLNFINRYQCRDGTYRWLEWRSYPSGNRIYAIARDITERKQAEEAFRESEERLRLTLEAINDGLWDWDITTGGAVFSPLWYSMLGYEPYELPQTYDSWRGLVHPEDVDRAEREINAHIASGEGYAIEMRMQTKPGSWRWVLTRGRVVERDADGHPVRMVGTHSDITERKRAEEALIEAESKYRSIFENAREGIYQSSPEGRYLTVNPAMAKIYGYPSPEEMVSGIRSIDREIFVIPEKRAELKHLVTSKGGAEGFEVEQRRKDGSTFWASLNVHAVYDDDGDIRYWEGRCIDITERLQRECEIKLLNRLYSVLHQVSQAVVKATTPGTFLEEACRVIAEEGGFLLSWIGQVEAETNAVVPVAVYGQAADYARGITVYADDRPEGRGPTGTSIRERRPIVYNNFLHDPLAQPWRERAGRFSLHAAAAFPVESEGRVWGALTIYSDEAGVFGDKDVKLLEKVAADIGFALDNLKRERQRREAEEALRESEERVRHLIDNTGDIIWQTDEEARFVYVSPQIESILGYRPEELIGKTPFAFLDPAMVEASKAAFQSAVQTKQSNVSFESQWFDRNGNRVIIESNATVIRDSDGSFGGFRGIDRDITDRKQAEEKLKDSEQLLQSIIQGYPIPAFMIGKDHRVIHWNRALEEVSGIGASTVIGTSQHWRAFYREERPCMADMLVDEDRDALAHWYADGVSKSEVLDDAYEAAGFFPDLSETGKWLRFTAAAVRNSRGMIVGAIETVEDITDREKAEEVLRESENRYRAIFENTGTATVILEEDYIISIANAEFEKLTGYTREEIENKKSWIEFVAKEDLEGMLGQHHLRRADANAALKQYEFRLVDRYGQTKDILLTIDMIAGTKRSVASLLDITDRKRAEEKYRSIFENAIEGIYQSTPEGRFLSVNPAFARIIGYDWPEEVLHTITDISRQLYVNPKDRADLLRLLEEQGTVKDFETRFLRKDKSVAWVTLNVRTVRDISGKLAYLEGTAEDITDHKILKAQLNQAQKLEAIGTLAGGIAHDFNNILAPIIGYSELSLNSVPENSRLHHNMKQILLSGNRAKELVKQILTFSRKTEQEPKPVRVSLLMKETLKFLRSSLPSTIEIRQALDVGAIESTVMADPTQIHRVLMNLCTNAAHAMREKGGVLSITLKNEDVESGARTEIADLEPGAYLRVSVADTGHGMNEAVRQRIFDPYFTTKGPAEGTGLGLAVVYGIVKNLSGGIAVRSKAGEGTTFDVYFPRTKAIKAPAVDVPVSLPKGKGLALLVDDEKSIVDMLKHMLESLGYEVVERYSSPGALQAFKAHPESFDLVITDLTMPHMTGLDLAREILTIRADTPIILCTGFSEAIDEDRIKVLGIQALLMKPISLHDLSVAVSKILAQNNPLILKAH